MCEKFLTLPGVREYGLDEKDILCVAVLFNAYLNDKIDTSARKIIERLEERERAL